MTMVHPCIAYIDLVGGDLADATPRQVFRVGAANAQAAGPTPAASCPVTYLNPEGCHGIESIDVVERSERSTVRKVPQETCWSYG